MYIYNVYVVRPVILNNKGVCYNPPIINIEENRIENFRDFIFYFYLNKFLYFINYSSLKINKKFLRLILIKI